ncbi:MAG: von Willebrand factor type [Rhodospirillales bacterium]|nr:von Willebrand factor type [Rhodospirillales bacterium]
MRARLRFARFRFLALGLALLAAACDDDRKKPEPVASNGALTKVAAPSRAAAAERRNFTWRLVPSTEALESVEQALSHHELPSRATLDVASLVAGFAYDVPAPHDAPFEVHTTLLRSPWNESGWLLHVAVRSADGTKLGNLAAEEGVAIEFDPTEVARARPIGGDRVAMSSDGKLAQALYELTPARPWALRREPPRTQIHLGTVQLHWRTSTANEPSGLARAIAVTAIDDVEKVDSETRFAIAAAAFGLVLRGDRAVRDFDYGDVEMLAAPPASRDPDGRRARMLAAVRIADHTVSGAPERTRD